MMPISEATMIVAHSFSGPVMYCWLKVKDCPPQSLLNAARPFADDRSDDARCGRDLERGEEVRHARR